jgi:MFS family permease
MSTRQGFFCKSCVDKELDDLLSAGNLSRTTQYPFRSIFKRKYRPQLVIALLIPFFNQVTGINVINFYTPVMFRIIGLKENASLLSSIVTHLCATFANIVAIILVDRSGRRKLLLVGNIQMILSQFTVGAILAAKFKDHGEMDKDYAYLVLIIMCVFVAGYGWSWGPLTFLIPSEVCPLEIRSAGQSIVVVVTFLMTFVISQTFLAILCRIKPATFFVFGAWICLTLFVYMFLPETKRLPMEQVKHVWRRHWFWKKIVREEQEEKKQAGTAALSSS